MCFVLSQMLGFLSRFLCFEFDARYYHSALPQTDG